MANSYTKAAFHLLVSAEEAAMLRLAERAVDILDTNGADEDLALGYDSLGTAFRALFPPKGASMFESFLELFDDWSFPYLDCRIDLDEPDANGKVMAFFHGDQFGVEPVRSATDQFGVCIHDAHYSLAGAEGRLIEARWR